MKNQKKYESKGNCLPTKPTGDKWLSAKSYCHFFLLSSLLWMINAPIILTPALEHDSGCIGYFVQSLFQVRVSFCYSHLTLTLEHLGSFQMAVINYTIDGNKCDMIGKNGVISSPNVVCFGRYFLVLFLPWPPSSTMWLFFPDFGPLCYILSCSFLPTHVASYLVNSLSVVFQHIFGLL